MLSLQLFFCFEQNRIRCRLLEDEEKRDENESKQSIHLSIQSINNLINKLTASYLVFPFFLFFFFCSFVRSSLDVFFRGFRNSERRKTPRRNRTCLGRNITKIKKLLDKNDEHLVHKATAAASNDAAGPNQNSSGRYGYIVFVVS